ncbi:MAG: PucR family transcriptional regulator [Microbacterium sp.]|uniref:PucR family transcriptional regulator n=1 Tax=Microbacterium sp. TaxID=51671 RepID=UPI0039E58408
MSSPADPPTVRALLRRTELRLRLAVDEDRLAAGALDRVIRGVHSSDLADPTPFLSEDLALLTTGTQFTGADPADYAAYVERLVVRGVVALGFGTEVVPGGIPEGLAAACGAARLPLFEVPYRTPFIAVARANARALAAQDFARRTWALDAQRALSLAALRSDGLAAAVDELSRRLDAWVGLFDAAGVLRHEHPRDGAGRTELQAEVTAMLARGTRAGATVAVSDGTVVLQSLGRPGHLTGVLALATGVLDAEARSVVTMVVAMADLALEQRRGLLRARDALRAGLAVSLLDGGAATARRVASRMWGGLPPAPVRVALTDAGGRDDVVEWLESQADGRGSRLFFGRIDAGLLLVVPASDDTLLPLLAERSNLAVGVSDPVGYDEVAAGLAQARVALEGGGSGVRVFADARGGLAAAFDGERARVLADAELAPLRAADAAGGTQLQTTLAAWLAHDGSHERTAQALGIHRHTLRARLAAVERALDVDLTSFAVRARLWLAFEVAQRGAWADRNS